MAELESVKQSLDSWREVAVILYSVITWEQVSNMINGSHKVILTP